MAQPSQGNPTPNIGVTQPDPGQLVNAEGVPLTGYVPTWQAGGFAKWAATGGAGSQTLAQTLALGNDANALKIVNLANGVASSDAATVGQITSGGSSLTPTAVKTSNYNAVAGDLIPCDISAGSFTVTLPTAPADKTQVCVEVVNRVTAITSNGINPFYVTVATGGSDVLFRAGGATSGIVGRGSIILQYAAASGIWYAPGTGDFLPVGWQFGYDQIVSPVNIISTTEASGTAIVTCASHVFDGGTVIAHFDTPYLSVGSVPSFAIVSLFEPAAGTPEIGRLFNSGWGTATANTWPVKQELLFAPSAGPHSFVVSAFVGSTTGTPAVHAGSGIAGNDIPTFVRFTKA